MICKHQIEPKLKRNVQGLQRFNVGIERELMLSTKIFLSILVICESPLFIRPHSKAVLSKAIYNDTEFLSTNMVMDYSLLVGIDEAKGELVVAIIGRK